MGLQTVVRGKQGHAPSKTSSPKILMADNYCGCQLAHRLGWTTTAYHKKIGATPHPGACKHSLQDD